MNSYSLCSRVLNKRIVVKQLLKKMLKTILKQAQKGNHLPVENRQALAKRVMPVCFVLSVLIYSNPVLSNQVFSDQVLSSQLKAEKTADTAPNTVNKTSIPHQINMALQTELLAMQQATITLHQKKFAYSNGKLPKKLIDDIAKISTKNSERLLTIIESHGWPSIDLVGLKGRDAAFVIVQQSTPLLQASLLPILKNEFEQGQLSGQKLASLIDNNLIKLGKKQRYGTQLAIVNGQIVFNKIEDEKKLDQRRLKMNMMPMAQYKKLLSKMYQLD